MILMKYKKKKTAWSRYFNAFLSHLRDKPIPPTNKSKRTENAVGNTLAYATRPDQSIYLQ